MCCGRTQIHLKRSVCLCVRLTADLSVCLLPICLHVYRLSYLPICRPIVCLLCILTDRLNLPACLNTFFTICLFICLPACFCLSEYRQVGLSSVCLPACYRLSDLPICLPKYLPTYLPICLSACCHLVCLLSICLPACLCLSVCYPLVCLL